jgi:hypothetical protein
MIQNLLLDGGDMGCRDLAHIVAGAAAILIERHQLAAVVYGKAEVSRAAQKGQPVDVVARIGSIAIAGTLGADQPDFLIVADGFCRQAGVVGSITDIHHGVLDSGRSSGIAPIEFPSQSREGCCLIAIVAGLPARKLPHIGIARLASKANASKKDCEKKAAHSCRHGRAGHRITSWASSHLQLLPH